MPDQTDTRIMFPRHEFATMSGDFDVDFDPRVQEALRMMDERDKAKPSAAHPSSKVPHGALIERK
jgi:hypothetical protein